MNETEDRSATDHTLAFDALPIVAEIEMDRFCEDCGYNLRTQVVRRDLRTKIPLTRCPECGRFHPVTGQTSVFSPWLRRLATILLAFWILVVFGTVIGLGFAQGGLTVVALEELSRRSDLITRDAAGHRERTRRPALHARRDSSEYKLTVGLTAAGSLAVSSAGLALLTIVCHHWRRAPYHAVALGLPTIAALIVWAILWYDAPRSMQWEWGPCIYGNAMVQMIGGLVGVMSGRPLARLLIRIVLPPRARQALAFLWLADGKKPPGTATPDLPSTR